MTTQEAIKVFNWEKQRFPHAYLIESGAVDAALAALRAQEEAEKNEPLTLDELRQMDGEPVWVVIENDRPMLFLVDTKNPCQMMRDPEHGALSVLDIADYGEEWLAHRHKPKEDAGNGL